MFLRIQAQNQKLKEDEKRKEETNKEKAKSPTSGVESEAEVGRTPSPEPADENWYSSDDEDSTKKESPLNVVLKTLNAEKVGI